MGYLKTKLKNEICRIMPDNTLSFHLQNISNDNRKGCCGHIVDDTTGRCVYVNTQGTITNPSKAMYRFAKNVSDFSSEHENFKSMNQFALQTELAEAIKKAFSIDETMWRRATGQNDKLTLKYLTGENLMELSVKRARVDNDTIEVAIDSSRTVRIPYSRQCILCYINNEFIEPKCMTGYRYALEGYDKDNDIYEELCISDDLNQLRIVGEFFKEMNEHVKSTCDERFDWYNLRSTDASETVIETI